MNKIVEIDTSTEPEMTLDKYTGIVTATCGSKSSTLQLPTREGQGYAILPSTKYKLIDVGVFYKAYISTNEPFRVLGDPNLKPENIKKGVSIFEVKGAYDPPKTETVTINYKDIYDIDDAEHSSIKKYLRCSYTKPDGQWHEDYYGIASISCEYEPLQVVKGSIVRFDCPTDTTYDDFTINGNDYSIEDIYNDYSNYQHFMILVKSDLILS